MVVLLLCVVNGMVLSLLGLQNPDLEFKKGIQVCLLKIVHQTLRRLVAFKSSDSCSYHDSSSSYYWFYYIATYFEVKKF